jgi:hypothetical protein
MKKKTLKIIKITYAYISIKIHNISVKASKGDSVFSLAGAVRACSKLFAVLFINRTQVILKVSDTFYLETLIVKTQCLPNLPLLSDITEPFR